MLSQDLFACSSAVMLHILPLLKGNPGFLECLDVFEPHLLLSNIRIVLDDGSEFMLDRGEFPDFLLAKRPDGHG